MLTSNFKNIGDEKVLKPPIWRSLTGCSDTSDEHLWQERLYTSTNTCNTVIIGMREAVSLWKFAEIQFAEIQFVWYMLPYVGIECYNLG